MKKFYTLLLLATSTFGFAQNNGPAGNTTSLLADWSMLDTKAVGDSCGAYFNNYIGIEKTVLIREEPMRTGANFPDDGSYNGRAQRFSAPQDIEVSGVEFYAYIKNNPTMDSIMVITTLNEYDAPADSMGVEVTRDTVYVKHHAFTVALPNMSVKSYFDSPITVSDDYMVTIYTPTNDSLFIIANNPGDNAGAGENLGYALYDNPTPGYEPYNGWYSMLTDFAYDYDFLIAPLVKYDLHDEFNVVNDTICPGITNNLCASFAQEVIFTSNQYNDNSASSTSSIRWYWGDNTFNAGLTSACHTYNNSGTYTINVQDTLYKYDYEQAHCLVNLTQDIYAQDTVAPNFSFIQTNVDVDFTNTTSFADSISWDFGDGSTAGNENTPTHTYATIGTFDVWLYAYNDCTEDSIMFQVTTDDVGLTEYQDLIQIYPNPANYAVTINMLPLNSMVSIKNVIGEEVMTTQANESKLEINTNALSNGTYFIIIESETNIVTKKLIVRH